MDRLGLPVFASVRPRGLTLRVHAGKGWFAIDARVGALMEAIEYAAAEPQRSRWQCRTLSMAEMQAMWPGRLRLRDFAPRIDANLAADRVIDTVACEDLTQEGAFAWLPAELIFVPFESRHGPYVFGWSTNGLASGNSIEEATLHALLEVLERDAFALNVAHDTSQWVERASLPAPLREYADGWQRLGVELAVRSIPNDFGLPCFVARLYERGDVTVDLAGGAGLHPDRGIALVRAVCEAAQSRLSIIHGGRDDITTFYAKRADPSRSGPQGSDNPLVEATFDRRRSVRFEEVLDANGDIRRPLAEQLSELLVHLKRSGFPAVFRYRYGLDLNGLAVVKVIVPRCEDVEDRVNRMGARLYARVMADA